jgi:hypothetical protein
VSERERDGLLGGDLRGQLERASGSKIIAT